MGDGKASFRIRFLMGDILILHVERYFRSKVMLLPMHGLCTHAHSRTNTKTHKH